MNNLNCLSPAIPPTHPVCTTPILPRSGLPHSRLKSIWQHALQPGSGPAATSSPPPCRLSSPCFCNHRKILCELNRRHHHGGEELRTRLTVCGVSVKSEAGCSSEAQARMISMLMALNRRACLRPPASGGPIPLLRLSWRGRVARLSGRGSRDVSKPDRCSLGAGRTNPYERRNQLKKISSPIQAHPARLRSRRNSP
jgi:hypothetical protein